MNIINHEGHEEHEGKKEAIAANAKDAN